MRGQAEVAAPGELPAWWDEDRAGAGDEPGSLRAVACLARALRAERLARADRARRAAEGHRRLVRAILAAEVAGRDTDELRAPAGAGRGSGR
jgi:hypothetical protein